MKVHMAEKLKRGTLVHALGTGLLLATLSVGLTACQFQPLYNSDSGTIGAQNLALSRMSVAQVDTRAAQQVRNHLIFLLSGGASPVDPSHEVRLRVNSNADVLAGAISESDTGIQKGNTAGRVSVNVSYEIYDFASKQIVHRGSRGASAAFDRNNQAFAAERAIRDAENRAAREAAEQLRLAISSDLNHI